MRRTLDLLIHRFLNTFSASQTIASWSQRWNVSVDLIITREYHFNASFSLKTTNMIEHFKLKWCPKYHFRSFDFVGFEGIFCEQPINQVLSNQSNTKSGAQNDLEEHCALLGCVNTDVSNGTCSGRCIQAGCFNQEQLDACRAWIDCLEATKTDFGVGQPTCVERYRNGICDYECAIANCFYDGFDCTDDGWGNLNYALTPLSRLFYLHAASLLPVNSVIEAPDNRSSSTFFLL